MPAASAVQRCHWARNELAIAYHDREWGVPVHDDRLLFEFLILEGAQAGLSWDTILQKRPHYRRVYDNFEPVRVARYDARKCAALLADPGIIRNRLKIAASVRNAQAFLRVQEEFGTFDRYVWGFVDGRPQINHWRTPGQVPATSAASDALARDLKRRGFSFVGSTICYAFMQATGLVNDHLRGCFRHAELARLD